ncbi:MAG: hypothetical protein N3B21_04860 [Clostridia bacterium]|nr:hypothetical protein [Clostridia bacterium]
MLLLKVWPVQAQIQKEQPNDNRQPKIKNKVEKSFEQCLQEALEKK